MWNEGENPKRIKWGFLQSFSLNIRKALINISGKGKMGKQDAQQACESITFCEHTPSCEFGLVSESDTRSIEAVATLLRYTNWL